MQNGEDFYIKISKYILSNEKLSSNDKIIYSLINNLTKMKGFCWASNKRISEITTICQRAVQNSINKLIKLKYICKWKQRKGTTTYRILTTNDELLKSNNNIKQLVEKAKTELFDYDWLNEND